MSIHGKIKTTINTRASMHCVAAPKQRIVLLQGPVGPFFRHLKRTLEHNNFDAWRISFNAGDAFFSRSKRRVNFRGNIADWRHWFSEFVSTKRVDCIILFGTERAIHQVAREVAKLSGVLLISLEEGYLRPGYITAELGGNNAASPLAGQLPPEEFISSFKADPNPEDFNGLRNMFFYAAVYYAIRSLCTFGKRRTLFHRSISLHIETFYWLRNFYRRIASGARDSATICKLIDQFCGNYYLIPLQVAADGQMQFNALGWSDEKLVHQAIESFVRSAPKDHRLVFKIHPMERGHSNRKSMISDIAKELDVSSRVDIIETGSLGLLTKYATGMITINSSSGFSAIFHGTPLMVIGKAIYAHDKLATCANGDPDFETFWNKNFSAPHSLRENYLHWIKEKALIQGDFYSARGITTACGNIVARIKCAEFC